MQQILDLGFMLLPLLGTSIGVVFVIVIAQKLLLSEHSINNDNRLTRKLILVGLYVAGFLAIALSLPVAESTRNQVIGLFGIVLSGIIAFSSTSIVANIMAGIVLKMTKPFRTGDFIRVNQYFGRVSDKGLFDTEIQTEQRELVAFTNSYLTSNPVTVIRSSGTILSANLSIGYDHAHTKISELLIQAAKQSKLEDPFVEIIELGNYSISYRISGLLEEVKSMISARSKLYANILDTLHAADVEIMSPNFMNTRQISDDGPAIPKMSRQEPIIEVMQSSPESMIFDKAEKAEQKELKALQLADEIKALQTRIKQADEPQKEELKAQLERKQLQIKTLEQAIDE